MQVTIHSWKIPKHHTFDNFWLIGVKKPEFMVNLENFHVCMTSSIAINGLCNQWILNLWIILINHQSIMSTSLRVQPPRHTDDTNKTNTDESINTFIKKQQTTRCNCRSTGYIIYSENNVHRTRLNILISIVNYLEYNGLLLELFALNRFRIFSELTQLLNSIYN